MQTLQMITEPASETLAQAHARMTDDGARASNALPPSPSTVKAPRSTLHMAAGMRQQRDGAYCALPGKRLRKSR
ncbi:hypothetical protein [Chitinimonas sp. BJYL2]|uniref:hypothetical protein n=1 Tax=Chitinimonas sp. BJYL2 TaxID=2976696 RepID=UPI0022B534F5|nr:hypothetical protein [Chitinimonas sp. BJYL2]